MATTSRPRQGIPRALIEAFDEHDLLTSASAIAFNAIFAVIPLALFGLGLCGVIGVDGIWRDHIAPQVRGQVSHPMFEVLDSSVRRVLGGKQIFWVTFGAALAVWEVSGAMRGTMSVLDRLHHIPRSRGRVERYRVSLLLSAAVTVLLVLATLAFELGPLAGTAAAILRWPVTAALLALALALVVRWGPAEQRPWRWVSFGTAVTVGAWLLMSLGFGLYLRLFADYGSIYGNLATVIIAFEYAYLSAIVGLGGLALDAIAQRG